MLRVERPEVPQAPRQPPAVKGPLGALPPVIRRRHHDVLRGIVTVRFASLLSVARPRHGAVDEPVVLDVARGREVLEGHAEGELLPYLVPSEVGPQPVVAAVGRPRLRVAAAPVRDEDRGPDGRGRRACALVPGPHPDVVRAPLAVPEGVRLLQVLLEELGGLRGWRSPGSRGPACAWGDRRPRRCSRT